MRVKKDDFLAEVRSRYAPEFVAAVEAKLKDHTDDWVDRPLQLLTEVYMGMQPPQEDVPMPRGCQCCVPQLPGTWMRPDGGGPDVFIPDPL